MRIENLKIKEDISLAEQIAAIDYIVSRCFEFDEEGYISDFQPYYKKIGMVEAIATFFIEGIVFDDNEIIYETIMKNEEVKNVIDMFFVHTKTKRSLTHEQAIMQFVIDNVNEKLDYMKQVYLIKLEQKKDSLSLLLDTITEKVDQMNIEDINKGMRVIAERMKGNEKKSEIKD